MKSDFMDRIAKIIAEVRTVTFIDSYDAGRIEEILQNELHECYDDGYDDGYSNCEYSLDEDVNNAYDEGYALGYSEGRSDGYVLGHSDGANADC